MYDYSQHMSTSYILMYYIKYRKQSIQWDTHWDIEVGSYQLGM